MLAVVIGMVFFRADSLETALRYLRKMLIWDTSDGVLMLRQYSNHLIVSLIVALVFVFPVYSKVKTKIRNLVAGTRWSSVTQIFYKVGLLAAFLISFSYAVSNGYASFLYEVF